MRAILTETIRSIGFDDALALSSLLACGAMLAVWSGVATGAI